MSEGEKKMKSDETMQRYLAFSLGSEEYSIPIAKVKEVIAFPDITPVPYSAAHFLGIMNLRGNVISIIDLRLKLKTGKAENTPETAVIILDLNPLCLGVVVSSVNHVLTLDEGSISAPPDVETFRKNEAIRGVIQKDKRLILLLDIAKALDCEDLKTIDRAQGTGAKAA